MIVAVAEDGGFGKSWVRSAPVSVLLSEDRMRDNNVIAIVAAVRDDDAVIVIVVEVVLKMAANLLNRSGVDGHAVELNSNRLDPDSRYQAGMMVIQQVEKAIDVTECVPATVPVSVPDLSAKVRTFDFHAHVIHRVRGRAGDPREIPTFEREKVLSDCRDMGRLDEDTGDRENWLRRVRRGFERTGVARLIDEAEAHPSPSLC